MNIDEMNAQQAIGLPPQKEPRPHVGACTCPICCPDKWAINRMVQTALMNSPMTQTGIPASGPQNEAIAEILVRLKRIEEILEAHVKR
jgi:hypothetical protein